jgi:hypothetical protein
MLGSDFTGFDETGEALNFLRRLFCGLHRAYRYENAVFSFRAKLNFAWDEGEQGMILAHADIGARMHFRAALAHNNVAGDNLLAAIALHAEPTTR